MCFHTVGKKKWISKKTACVLRKYWFGGEDIIVKIIFEILVNNDSDGDVGEF